MKSSITVDHHFMTVVLKVVFSNTATPSGVVAGVGGDMDMDVHAVAAPTEGIGVTGTTSHTDLLVISL